MKGTNALPGSAAGTANSSVERRAVVLVEIAVRLGHRVDARRGEFLGQALVVGGEHALASPAGLG